jgi:hypothetical protein
VERGWDIKAIVRLIVNSATYRQSSAFREELAAEDPGNRLLARQTPRRLDAEFVRDNALFAAGLLDPEIGGPSCYPYQPAGFYDSMNMPPRVYTASSDERQYRRGLYVHRQRTFPHPMLTNFDAPSREECTAARTISSTPQQALTLLNDPTFVESGRVLATRVLREARDPNFRDQLDFAFESVLARPASPREQSALAPLYQRQLEHYRQAPEEARKLLTVGQRPPEPGLDAAEVAAWTNVARVLLNLNETIVRY